MLYRLPPNYRDKGPGNLAFVLFTAGEVLISMMVIRFPLGLLGF